MTKLTPSELTRYDRQMIVPGWGLEGQKKLKEARVIVTGSGGLGCPASIYLTVAGVGKLVIIDKERFELSNLNRQVLGWQKDIGRLKAEAAAEKLRAMNPDIEVEPLIVEITEDNVRDLIRGANVVVDAMDNWVTRFLINRVCVEERIPFVHAGIHGLHGQVTTIVPGKGPCLRCILPKTPSEIKRFPVLGATPAFFAILQTMETLKLILGIGKPLVGRMLLFDGEDMSFQSIKVNRRTDCPVCGGI